MGIAEVCSSALERLSSVVSGREELDPFTFPLAPLDRRLHTHDSWTGSMDARRCSSDRKPTAHGLPPAPILRPDDTISSSSRSHPPSTIQLAFAVLIEGNSCGRSGLAYGQCPTPMSPKLDSSRDGRGCDRLWLSLLEWPSYGMIDTVRALNAGVPLISHQDLSVTDSAPAHSNSRASRPRPDKTARAILSARASSLSFSPLSITLRLYLPPTPSLGHTRSFPHSFTPSPPPNAAYARSPRRGRRRPRRFCFRERALSAAPPVSRSSARQAHLWPPLRPRLRFRRRQQPPLCLMALRRCALCFSYYHPRWRGTRS